MYSFLGLITPGNPSFPAQGCTTLHRCFRLKSGRKSKATKRLETSCRQNEDSGYVKAEGQGSITPFFYSPPSPSLRAPLKPCLSQVIPPLRNLTCHWLTSHPPGDRQGEVKGGRGGTPAREISFVSLVAYGSKFSHSALAMGVTASETRQGSSQHCPV